MRIPEHEGSIPETPNTFPMKITNFGFIGAGKIAGYSAASVASHGSGRVVAIQDLSLPRMEELQKEHNIPKAYGTAEELLADEEIDAVYIAVPNKFHAPLALAALEAGKHVMLEKPFAMNADEAREVVELAKKKGLVFTLGMNQRFLASGQRIREMVRAGTIGEVYHAKAYWLRRSGIPKLGTWFGNKALAGAGAINDIGVHALDLCLHLVDNFDPVTVTASTYTKFGDQGLGEGGWGLSDKEHQVFDVDDFASVFIRMRNGCSITLDAAWACHVPTSTHFNVQLFGTKGGLSLDPLQYCHPGEVEGEYAVEETLEGPLPMTHCDRFHNFINHLHGSEELAVKPEEALAVQIILDAAGESARTGREIAIA